MPSLNIEKLPKFEYVLEIHSDPVSLYVNDVLRDEKGLRLEQNAVLSKEDLEKLRFVTKLETKYKKGTKVLTSDSRLFNELLEKIKKHFNENK